MKRKTTEEKSIIVYEYVTLNYSKKFICEKYQISAPTLISWCKEFGMRKRKSDSEKEKIVKKYKSSKHSAAYIAKKYNVSERTIFKWCNDVNKTANENTPAQIHVRNNAIQETNSFEQKKTDIVYDYISSNVSAENIADKYYISIRTLFYYRKSCGYKKQNNRIKEVIINLIRQDLCCGFSNKMIQKKYGLSDRTLWYYLKIAKSK